MVFFPSLLPLTFVSMEDAERLRKPRCSVLKFFRPWSSFVCGILCDSAGAQLPQLTHSTQLFQNVCAGAHRKEQLPVLWLSSSNAAGTGAVYWIRCFTTSPVPFYLITVQVDLWRKGNVFHHSVSIESKVIEPIDGCELFVVGGVFLLQWLQITEWRKCRISSLAILTQAWSAGRGETQLPFPQDVWIPSSCHVTLVS